MNDLTPDATPEAAPAALPATTAPRRSSGFTTTLLILVIALLAGLFYWTNWRLNRLEQTLATLPQATINAIIALQNGETSATTAAQQPAALSIDNDAYLGDRDSARLVMLEFSDLNCGFCARYHSETAPQILDKYVRSGDLLYVYRDYIGVGGQVSLDAASAAECVRQQTGDQIYLTLISDLFGSAGLKNVASVQALAQDYGLDTAALDSCISDKRFETEVLADTRAGQAAGAQGTPAFFIGTLNEDGTLQGVKIAGAQPFEVFDQIISEQLAQLN